MKKHAKKAAPRVFGEPDPEGVPSFSVPTVAPAPVVVARGEEFALTFNHQSGGGLDLYKTPVPSGEVWEVVSSSAGNKDGAVTVFHMAAVSASRAGASAFRLTVPLDAGADPTFSAAFWGLGGRSLLRYKEETTTLGGRQSQFVPPRELRVHGGDFWVWGVESAGAGTINNMTILARRVA